VGPLKHRTYWLELCSPRELSAKPFALPGIALARLGGDEHERATRLWFEVGRGFWSEREDWPPARWREHLAAVNRRFTVARLGGEEVGFYSLARERDDVELEGFGLMPAWRGRGLGAGLLSAATREGFALGARRIWLHTASDDHPNALPNYLARGYRIYREEPLADPIR
jgi:ribosomal protein S18 acetylase RimI-like enzyme